MTVALCQLDIAWENKEANHQRVTEMAASAGLEPGALLVLPEMFATGFSMNVEAIAESEDGPTLRFLRGLARERGIFIVGGIVTREPDGRGLNQAVVFSPEGNELSRYAKVHPFMGGEARAYRGGAEIASFEWAGFCASPMICYDLRFPELFRVAACRGVELMLVIASWPGKRIQHWVTLLQARAIENQAYVIGVNRCGNDPYFEYPGRSLAVDPHGTILTEADSREQILKVQVDPQTVRSWRGEFPALRDMRCGINLGESR